MDASAIVPGRSAANVDLAGGDNWPGLTLAAAEQTNCAGTSEGDKFGTGQAVVAWGTNDEVWAEYDPTTQIVDMLSLFPGYTGTLTATSQNDNYAFAVGASVMKNSAPFTIDFSNAPALSQAINELYAALLATYLPALADNPDCQDDGECVLATFANAFEFPALGLALWFDDSGALSRIDLVPAKPEPFIVANVLMSLASSGAEVAEAGTPCAVSYDLSYGDFLSACVNKGGTPGAAQAALLGGLTHSDERFILATRGLGLSFSDESLAAGAVIADGATPASSDLLRELSIDSQELATIANDHTSNDPTQPIDLHGAGLVDLEYARLVQQTLNQFNVATGVSMHPLGDAACLAPNVDPQFLDFPPGCTGLEGFVTAAPSAGTTFPDNAIGMAAVSNDAALALGLSVGTPSALICLDTAYSDCAAPAGATGALFSTTLARVTQVFADGDAENLPPALRGTEIYWQAYATALVKYLMVADTATEASVDAAPIAIDDLEFSTGPNNTSIARYVDRRFVAAGIAPVVFTVTADLSTGTIVSYDFQRQLLRGESAIASTVQSAGAALGQDDAFALTNIFGSPVLQLGWTEGVGYSAYECATTLNPSVIIACSQQIVPLSNSGAPLLLPYPGAFSGSATPFTLGAVPITITANGMLSVPIFSPPYSQSNPTTASYLLPIQSKRANVGFSVPITGVSNAFIPANAIDVTGTTMQATIYENPVQGPTNGALQFLAVTSSDFLGDVFACQDGTTGDLLHAALGAAATTAQEWLVAHPGSISNCHIVTTSDALGNVASITSLANGVILNFIATGGVNTLTSVTLFVPEQAGLP